MPNHHGSYRLNGLIAAIVMDTGLLKNFRHGRQTRKVLCLICGVGNSMTGLRMAL